jgi:hypothetical protein
MQLLGGVCDAASIAIKIKPSSNLSSGKVAISADVTNTGDEQARFVRIEARMEDSLAASETRDTLDSNGLFHVALDLGAAPSAGVHTAIVTVFYEDDAGFPFSTLSTIPLFTADPEAIKESVSVSMPSVPGRKDGDIGVNIKSPVSTVLTARVTLVLPDPFQCGKPVVKVLLQPHEEETLHFAFSKTSARLGRYPVIAVLDYDAGGLHHSVATSGRINILPYPGPLSFMQPKYWIAVIIFLIVVFAASQFIRLPDAPLPGFLRLVFPYAILVILAGFTLCFIPPSLLLTDTLTVGGDTVAHNYMVSHLKEQLFHHGRIISWANGWWCGFPLFQFYFCLPYVLMSALSFVIPFNIAFKLVSVLGILSLPACAYAAGRIMRLPRPGPILLAIAMIPLLFDVSNTKWGVNIYSTFAGMISNSISFPIMLLFIACSWRDADDGKFRLSTVFLLVLLVASHFFTSIIAGLTLAVFPFLRPKNGALKAIAVLFKECGLAFLLMAWWLLPLMAKRAYSMDFGENWAIDLWRDIPRFAKVLLLPAALALPLTIWRRTKFVAVTFWMLAASLFLLRYGYDKVSPVFVNVRLWPFVIYSLLALAACGVALLLEKLKAVEVAVTAILLAALVFGPGKPNSVRSWAEWNYEGLENKPRWPVFRDLVLPLDGTPGRLANDLSDRNSSFGSSRIFECVPQVIRKPILEGGIVNSAIGSMFSYYIQSETSDHCAGFPPIVKPTTFNFTNATKHLELFNVKHFIAVSPLTKAALAQSPDWTFLRESQGWQLYELTTHNGSYVFVPKNHPVPLVTNDWKHAGLDWIYNVGLLDQPRILLQPGESQPPETCGGSAITNICRIWDEKITDNSIGFRTSGIGLPHIVKFTYYPNWKVRGAKRIYMVTPCFMLVYPEREEVELYYGSTLPDYAGRFLTALGLAATALVCCCFRKGSK